MLGSSWNVVITIIHKTWHVYNSANNHNLTYILQNGTWLNYKKMSYNCRQAFLWLAGIPHLVENLTSMLLWILVHQLPIAITRPSTWPGFQSPWRGKIPSLPASLLCHRTLAEEPHRQQIQPEGSHSHSEEKLLSCNFIFWGEADKIYIIKY